MKIKVDRFPVFLQIVAHRERWRRRAGAFAFLSRDLRALMLPRKVPGTAVPDVPMGRRVGPAATQS